MTDNLTFARALIKGRIAETIFELMFREDGRFTVIPIGYEHTMPELIQCKHHTHVQRVLDNLKDAPDFALVSQDKTQVYLVECKYRSSIDMSEVHKTCQEITSRYHPCFIFVATKEGFYYENCRNVKPSSVVAPLDTKIISPQLQVKYVTLLNEFTGR